MTNRISVKLTVLAAAALMTFSCTSKKEENKTAEAPQATATGQVNLAIWNNYISDELLAKFTKDTGIKVNLTTYASNEELLAKVQSGAAGFDVAVPSDYMVDVMKKMNLLQKIKPDLIPNSKNLSDFVLKQYYDPQNEYSYPYAWTSVGVAVNTELYKKEIRSWHDFLDNQELSGKISMLDDVRESLGAVLKSDGKSINTTDPKQVEQAAQKLLEVKKRIKMFRSETIDSLVNNEVVAAQAYSSDALQAAQKTNGKIKFILPVEGGSQAIDNLVILQGAQNTEAAHKLINFLLSSEVNVEFVKHVLGGPVLKTTKAALPKELANNDILFPTNEQLSKFERIKDLGADLSLYEKAWTKVKTE
ncbi:MAG: ABC transporter substrate-binding protein [Pseudobdellovibrio sp.]